VRAWRLPQRAAQPGPALSARGGACAGPGRTRRRGRVRSGADLVKALALGATAVGIGRPYAWGLALGGDDGVVHVLRSILAEADLIMAVDGYPTRADLTRDSLRRVR
jgi:FMN-dependent dehydrogenase